ncbi:restriction endonuclease [Streptomyces rubiginosohelvolus]
MDRGTRFEELVLQYLSTDPRWAEQFSRVWMWTDWPGAEQDKRDTGIYLVAQDRNFCAIQCKSYEPQHANKKYDIGSSFTASGTGGPRVIISTTEKWGCPRRGRAGRPANPRHAPRPVLHRQRSGLSRCSPRSSIASASTSSRVRLLTDYKVLILPIDEGRSRQGSPTGHRRRILRAQSR